MEDMEDKEAVKMTEYDIFNEVEKRLEISRVKYMSPMTGKLLLDCIMNDVKTMSLQIDNGKHPDVFRDATMQEGALRIMATCKRYIKEVYNKDRV